MSSTEILFYREGREVPALDWLLEQPLRVKEECLAVITFLSRYGHLARRPHVENIGHGLYELRARVGRVQYRMIFFFHGQGVVVIATGFSKERRLPPVEIDRALDRKERYERNPGEHTAEIEL